MNVWRTHAWWGMAATLGVLAVLQPVALYLFALAVFGLPHVIWEMVWVRRVWGKAMPTVFWCTVILVLFLQGAARLLLWMGRIDASSAAALDTATLAMVLVCIVWVLPRVPRARRALVGCLSILIPVVLVAVSDTPYVMGVLAVLAMAHNFTPLGLMPAQATIGHWPARPVLGLLFAAPVVLFLGLWWSGLTPTIQYSAGPPEWQWAQRQANTLAGALLPALVWAQCLHYLCVLYLMPLSLGRAWTGMPRRHLVLMLCGIMTAGFVVDYSAARGLYAVVAGMHAWLEWPLILLGMAGVAAPQNFQFKNV